MRDNIHCHFKLQLEEEREEREGREEGGLVMVMSDTDRNGDNEGVNG